MRNNEMRFVRLFLLAFAAACAATTAPAAPTSPTLDRIRDTTTIRFAYREGAAPFSFKDRDGRVRGYSVELCARIAAAIQKDLGVKELKVEWIPADAATRLELVTSGKADAECGTTTITLSREKSVAFSRPIFVEGGSALVDAKSKLTQLSDLKGKKIAVIAGTTTEQALVREFNTMGMKAILVPVHSTAEGMAMLMKHKADAFAGDRTVLGRLKLTATRPADYDILANDFSFEPYGLVLPREDPDFRLAVDRALASLYRTGEIDPIFQRWLAPYGKPGPLLHAMFYLNTIPE
jgi:polar amino acid transport system substrate-binding protein/glutamate/aspartate transport system substrate-binding protein